MLNKLQFNNLIISNKKKIQQARIQTINKLVQKLRKFKIQLEKKPENAKCKQQLRKATLCMEQLKLLKCVEIIKKVLLLEKNPQAIITNGRATPEELAIAMLATNKIMRELIALLKTQLQLNEQNTKWRAEILEDSKRREKIKRTEEKRRKRQEGKVQKAFEHKRLEWIRDNNPTASQYENGKELSDGEDRQLSTSGIWNEEPLEQQAALETKPKLKSIKEKQQNKAKAKKPLKNEKEKSSDIYKEHTVEKELKVQEIVKQEKILREVAEESNNGSTEIEMAAALEEQVTHVMDPFFVTDNGENYLSSAVVTRTNDSDQSNNKREEKTKRTYDQVNKYNKMERNSNKMQNNQQNKVIIKENSRRDVVQNLHPSWLAKQKQKPIISAFHGKKITFNDDDEATPQVQQIKTSRALTNGQSKQQQSENNADKLHPSWIAKQKLKTTITAFQGKKITFNNDDE